MLPLLCQRTFNDNLRLLSQQRGYNRNHLSTKETGETTREAFKGELTNAERTKSQGILVPMANRRR
jgi:hypothetical protein